MSICSATAGYGDHICCLPTGHPERHECRKWRDPDGVIWAAWWGEDGDSEPYACNHEEMQQVGHQADSTVVWVRCTRCGVTYRQVDDPDGPTTLTTKEGGEWVNKRIRYEEVTRG